MGGACALEKKKTTGRRKERETALTGEATAHKTRKKALGEERSLGGVMAVSTGMGGGKAPEEDRGKKG